MEGTGKDSRDRQGQAGTGRNRQGWQEQAGMDAGTGRDRQGCRDRQEFKHSSHKLLLVDLSVPAVTELWLQLLQVLERRTRDTHDFKNAIGLKMLI